jgi:hypothetical protein
MGFGDVPFLRRFIPSQEQQDNRLLIKSIIDAIARAVINLQFINPFADRTVLAEITQPDTVEPDTDLLPSADIPETIKPFLERLLARFGQVVLYRVREGLHDDNVAYKLHLSKGIINGYWLEKIGENGQTKDTRLWQRFSQEEKLPPPKRKQIVQILDALLGSEKAKKTG